MRRTSLPGAMVCCALLVSGCGATTARDGATRSASPGSPRTSAASAAPSTPAPADTLAAYRYLVHDVTGFVAAGIDAGQQTPDVSPDDPAEVLALVGYDLADGVELARWEEAGICFTGPGDTFWSFGEARRVYLRLSLGTGGCGVGTPDVVVDIAPRGDDAHLVTHVRTGADVAAQLPELDDVVRLMNDRLR